MAAIPSRRTAPGPGRSLLGLAVFLAAVTAAALIGVLASTETAQDYARLQQPSWAPPSWVFGPVWTVLYVLVAVAGWLVWRGHSRPVARTALVAYAVQLVLNAAWTPLFFAAGLRGTALIEISVLWVAIGATIVLFRPLDVRAALLMAPYWAWTSFAVVLNAAVWWLNA